MDSQFTSANVPFHLLYLYLFRITFANLPFLITRVYLSIYSCRCNVPENVGFLGHSSRLFFKRRVGDRNANATKYRLSLLVVICTSILWRYVSGWCYVQTVQWPFLHRKIVSLGSFELVLYIFVGSAVQNRTVQKKFLHGFYIIKYLCKKLFSRLRRRPSRAWSILSLKYRQFWGHRRRFHYNA